jgi:hypothetical protein
MPIEATPAEQLASKTLILDNISGKMALRYHYTRA